MFRHVTKITKTIAGRARISQRVVRTLSAAPFTPESQAELKTPPETAKPSFSIAATLAGAYGSILRWYAMLPTPPAKETPRSINEASKEIVSDVVNTARIIISDIITRGVAPSKESALGQLADSLMPDLMKTYDTKYTGLLRIPLSMAFCLVAENGKVSPESYNKMKRQLFILVVVAALLYEYDQCVSSLVKKKEAEEAAIAKNLPADRKEKEVLEGKIERTFKKSTSDAVKFNQQTARIKQLTAAIDLIDQTIATVEKNKESSQLVATFQGVRTILSTALQGLVATNEEAHLASLKGDAEVETQKVIAIAQAALLAHNHDPEIAKEGLTMDVDKLQEVQAEMLEANQHRAKRLEAKRAELKNLEISIDARVKAIEKNHAEKAALNAINPRYYGCQLFHAVVNARKGGKEEVVEDKSNSGKLGK